ncbi:MAG TPA: hypothetical protein VG674_02390 [Amycolatopsis sp.]|nr:hypothetical protein [Amycolatopsis sp.]
MAAFPRRFTVITLAGAGLAACSARVPSAPHTDDTTVLVPVTEVHLNTDAGSVRVDARPGASGVRVHRTAHNERGRGAGATTRIDATTLTLAGCEPRCAVDYTLTVPPGVVVDRSATTGSVTRTGPTA